MYVYEEILMLGNILDVLLVKYLQKLKRLKPLSFLMICINPPVKIYCLSYRQKSLIFTFFNFCFVQYTHKLFTQWDMLKNTIPLLRKRLIFGDQLTSAANSRLFDKN